MQDIIVVGGGASGLVAAIYAAKNTNNNVILLEKNNKCGKKILITGNGKCNYWNEDFNNKYFYCSNKTLLDSIISKSNQDTVLNFFKQIGIVPKIKNGYYYPMSNQAVTIQTALVKEAEISGVCIKYDCEVKNIEYNGKYVVKTNNDIYKCDKLILATGSKAAFNTGSTGDGYEFLKKFNHTINSLVPALVQLEATETYLKKWSGVRSDVNLSLYEDDKLISESCGEVQLTNYGISGVCTFQLSGIVSRGLLNRKKEVIKINFVPWLNKSFIDYMNLRNAKIKSRSISFLMDSLLNYKLVNLLLELSHINQNDKWDDISFSKKKNLESLITNFELLITGTKGFDCAQTCAGGVSIDEINTKTMESKLQKGLYIVGELIDVDGMCGGYNLGFAWITGMLAGCGVND